MLIKLRKCWSYKYPLGLQNPKYYYLALYRNICSSLGSNRVSQPALRQVLALVSRVYRALCQSFISLLHFHSHPEQYMRSVSPFYR